jgi:DNA repair protein RecO (recombination protein O)
MPACNSEAFVLRTYPFREADLIVSFFTRDQGKLRGIAKRARRPKSNFGAGLERLSLVKMAYFQQENRELVNMDSCELLRSPFNLQSHWETSVVLDYMAEVSDQILPPSEVNDRFFRLLWTVLEFLHAEKEKGNVTSHWPAVLYFSVWTVRLSGILPELRVREESKEIAREMMEKPIRDLPERTWTKETGADMRRLLTRMVEEHIERRIRSAYVLENL